MSEYQVIARKWRPRKFSDMVGQQHVIKTLKNAIKEQRTAHAYLFVGSRGIGKTTSARIFAKALNCLNPQDGEPCCECQSCVSFEMGNNMDVTEIDAASNNSVDSIRDLREEIIHVPVNSKYKIYIIDEVHMLSKNAWNALLKTVEEPPSHVKFIFATTEVHMVLPTIISRCQRFDLQPINGQLIFQRLREIVDTEKVKISDHALEAIARAAEGGMRDAQSLLDQMISFFAGSENEEHQISEKDVLSLFGLTSANEVSELIIALFNNSPAEVIAAIYALSKKGKNLETLFNDILGYLRNIQICQLVKNPQDILDIGEDVMQKCSKLAHQVNTKTVQIFLETLAPVGRTLHDALNKQVFLESILLKAMRSGHAISAEDVIKQLNSLRNNGELTSLDNVQVIEKKVVIPVDDEKLNIPANSVIAEKVTEVPVQQEAPSEITVATQFEPSVCEKKVVINTDIQEIENEEEQNIVDINKENNKIVNNEENITDIILENNLKEAHVAAENGIWQQLIHYVADNNIVDPITAKFLYEGFAKNTQGSNVNSNDLTVKFTGEYEHSHIEKIKSIKQRLQTAFIDVVGDWSAMLKLEFVENEIPTLHHEEMVTITNKSIESNTAFDKKTLLASIPDDVVVEKYDDTEDELKPVANKEVDSEVVIAEPHNSQSMPINEFNDLDFIVDNDSEETEFYIDDNSNYNQRNTADLGNTKNSKRKYVSPDKLKQEISDNGMIKEILDVFGGQIVEIH